MKAAIYCSLSEEDRIKTKEDSENIQNQKSMLVNYARERGWEIFGIYCDENYSGIDGDRPEYNRLLADAEKHCFDIILCKTQSRFSRNMEQVERYLKGKLQEWGIRFVSIPDNVDMDVRSNKKVIVSEEDFEKAGRMLLKSSIPFDILCGECQGVMRIQTKRHENKVYKYLWCKNCKKRINADFVKNFLSEKYAGQIRNMEITSKYSARIFFNV